MAVRTAAGVLVPALSHLEGGGDGCQLYLLTWVRCGQSWRWWALARDTPLWNTARSSGILAVEPHLWGHEIVEASHQVIFALE